jgi:type IV secretion system protein VirD4
MGKFEDWVRKAVPRGVPGRKELPSAAEWLDPALLTKGGWEFRKEGKVAGLFLGRWDGKEYGWEDDRHVLTVAGSRSGKGASLIIPNLLQYEGSVVAIDPKGELAELTAEHRATKLKQRVVVLDPFGVSGVAGGGFNPLDAIDLGSDEALDDALAIAEAMIQIPSSEPHWAESAQAVMQALILTVKLLPDAADRNLAVAHDLLMNSHREVVLYMESFGVKDSAQALFAVMAKYAATIAEERPEIAAVMQGVAATYGKMPEKERESVLSAARTQTRFLKSPALRRCLAETVVRIGGGDAKESWALGDIKRRPMTVYLCLPAKRMASHARWLRVVINLCLQSFETRAKVDIPVLMVLDEFNVLGHMDSIEKAAGQVAGFGVKLWTILQDVGQIEKLYKESWETFVGNAGVATFFGNADHKTLEYISKKLGRRTFLTPRPSERTEDQARAGVPLNRQELREERLLETHEIANLLGREKKSILVMAAERAPLLLERALYFDENDRFYKVWKGA